MYILACYYQLKHKPFVEEAIKHLPEVVFGTWHIVPEFKTEIHDACFEDEFEFRMEYNDPKDDENTVSNGHEAMDLAQAFISAWLLAKGESLE